MINKNENIIKDALKHSLGLILYRISVVLIFIIIGLIIPITQSEIVNNISNGTFNTVYIFLIATIILIILENIFDILTTHSYWKVYLSMTNYLSNKMLNETFNNSLYSLSRFNFSLYRNTMIKDIETITTFFTKLIIQLVKVFELCFVVVYFYIISITFGIILTITIILILLILLFSQKKIKEEDKIKIKDLDLKMNRLRDIFISIKDIKNFNIKNNVAANYSKVQDKSCSSLKHSDILNEGVKRITLIIIECSRYFIYALGIYSIMNNNMELGTILIIFNYFSKVNTDITEISNIFIKYSQYKVALKRYNKMFAYTHENATVENIEFITGDIKFNNVTFGDINNPSLKDTSLVFKQDEITIINGNVESGVDSVFELLNKFNFQHSGTITINDVDINAYTDEVYKFNVARISKSPMFFNMSIKDNLLLICDDIEFIISVSKLLNVHYLITKLPKGYDTILENDCSNVQFKLRYLLEILRVFLRDPKILLFDDIFDVLDDDDTTHLINLIEALKSNKTIIIKTTNKKIIDLSDNIIYFDNKNNIK